MAKAFVKKRTGGKARFGKKKVAGRATKKTASMSALRMKSIVAGEVQKVLNSGAHNERRKVTMELTLPDNQVFVNTKSALLNSIRIPITDAIPSQQGAEFSPDVRRRRANKILVTRVVVEHI